MCLVRWLLRRIDPHWDAPLVALRLATMTNEELDQELEEAK